MVITALKIRHRCQYTVRLFMSLPHHRLLNLKNVINLSTYFVLFCGILCLCFSSKEISLISCLQVYVGCLATVLGAVEEGNTANRGGSIQHVSGCECCEAIAIIKPIGFGRKLEKDTLFCAIITHLFCNTTPLQGVPC